VKRKVGECTIETTYAVDHAIDGIVGVLQVYGPTGLLLNTQVVTRALNRVELVDEQLRQRLEAVVGVDAQGQLSFR
jgi:hypothetical protein